MKIFVLSTLLSTASGFGTMSGRTAPCGGSMVTFAVEPNWAPWTSCDANPNADKATWSTDSCTGAVPGVVKEICEVTGLRCQGVVTEWTNIWAGSVKGDGWEAGHFHVAAAARNTAERQKECMAFSDPYGPPGDGVMMMDPSMDWNVIQGKIDDMTAKGCAIQGWAIGENYLKKLGLDTNNLIMADQNAVTAAVLDGTCDFALFDGDVSGGQLTTGATVPVKDHGVGGVSFMMDATDRHSDCVLDVLNKGLEHIRMNGDLETIMDKEGLEAETEFEHVNTNIDACRS